VARDGRVHLVRTALRRGLSKRCPHCGRGRLFHGRTHLARCAVCGLEYERNPGDTWAFTIIGDRVPIGIMIALLYFTFARSHPAIGIVAFVLMTALLIWTAPNRWGMGIALHYLSRVYWPEPADPIPPDPRDVADAAPTRNRSDDARHETGGAR
jgi:uncharacterized protein (DUF983 family)